ncbi:MAG: hypothetical protein ABI831_23210, partial [Betaproteobacteria bacterium]
GAGGGAQRVFGGTNDAFVSRFSADLGTLVNSTYLGATDSDKAYALAIHPGSGDIYLVGETGASGSTFPGVGGGAQKIFGGSTDAFVSRFSADLATLHRSSYLGAIDVDIAFAVAVHPISGEVYVAGYSITTGSTFPGVSGGARSTSGGSYEAFVSRFNADLTALLKSSYLGAAGDDLALAMAIHPVSGDVYLTGETSSPTGTFPGLSGAPQGVYGGGTFDGFVSRFSADLTLADTTPNAFAFAAQNNVPVSSVRTSEPVQINGLGAAANAYVDGQPGSTFCVSSSNDCSCNVSGSFVASGLVSDSQYVCVRQTASALVDQITSTTLHVGAQAGVFRVSTGNVFGGGCTFDVDGNGTPDALTDGLVILRAMFGLTGTPVTNGAIGAGATRATWAALRAFTNGNCGTNFAP